MCSWGIAATYQKKRFSRMYFGSSVAGSRPGRSDLLRMPSEPLPNGCVRTSCSALGYYTGGGSSMTNPFESFEERILGISKERLDAIDAELEAERNDPDIRPSKVEWLDDPDPFDRDWDWLYS